MRTHRAVLLAAALLALAAPTLRAQGVPPGFREQFLGQFRSSSSKLEALARAIPADKFAWSPGPGVMPVAQVYAHIARYNFYYPQTGMGVAPPAGVDVENLEKVADKERVVELLRRSAAHVVEAVGRMPDEQLARTTRLYGEEVPQWAVLFQLVAHMNEHLGQSIAYARMNGIAPPWSQ